MAPATATTAAAILLAPAVASAAGLADLQCDAMRDVVVAQSWRDVIAEVAHGDCLLVGGGSVAPGGTVSFNYTSYIRYAMTLLAATCDGGGSS